MQPQADYNILFTICKHFASGIFNGEGNIPRRGSKPRASDLEVLALSLLQCAYGWESESYFFAVVQKKLPGLAARVGTRRNYNERRKALYETTERVRRAVVREMEPSNPQKIYVIDSMPIESCRFARAKNSRVFRERFGSNPDYGFCASHQTNYFGYKFHAVCTPDGVIVHFELTPANVADISMLPEIRERFSNCMVLGDKGYLNRDVAMELFEYAGIELVVPYRSNMREQPVLPMRFGRTRKRVEVLFSQLVAQGGLRCIYAKRQRGLFGRIASKVCLFTFLQYINYLRGKPISQTRYTLVRSQAESAFPGMDALLPCRSSRLDHAAAAAFPCAQMRRRAKFTIETPLAHAPLPHYPTPLLPQLCPHV